MQLIKHPNKWLQTQTKPFDFAKQDAVKISNEMISTMTRLGGLGLAANQVELDAQIFVMKPTLLESTEPFEVINPVVLSISKQTEIGPEGCLSYPDLWLDIKRPRAIVAKYFDKHQQECTIELVDLDARCFLHEYDHLQGITFEDRVSKLKLNRARKKQQKRLKNG